jgi:phospholipid/cholesterol/gamma-HCH transport system ATP-binding protein
MIRFEHVVKRFGEKTVLDDVSLEIPEGRVQFVIGPSGTGKSVLMKHAVGLLKADSGTIHVGARDVTHLSEAELYAVRREVAYVFQHATLLDGLDIRDNVALPIEKRYGTTRAEARRRAEAELGRLQLEPWAHRFPSELGAGLKKRAAIARALALEPRYIIYDEPTTGLDPISARRVDRLIVSLKARGVTQIVVSHDLASIFGVADRIAMLYAAKVRIEGTPDALRAAPDPIVRQFLAGEPDGPM